MSTYLYLFLHVRGIYQSTKHSLSLFSTLKSSTQVIRLFLSHASSYIVVSYYGLARRRALLFAHEGCAKRQKRGVLMSLPEKRFRIAR